MDRQKSLPRGISVIIPSLNEKGTIQQVVLEARAALAKIDLPSEVIVADNGSQDGSPFLAAKAGARIVPVPKRGYGNALHHGILAAKHRWVIFADADLTYPFSELSDLMRPLIEGTADMVLGSRLRGNIETGAMPFLHRYLGTPVLSFLIRALYGLPTSDCNSGMRAFDKDKYLQLSLRCGGMEYASEMLIRASQRGLRYDEVPISFRVDTRGRTPHLRPWRDGWRHLRFILTNARTVYVVGAPSFLGFVFWFSAMLLSFESLWNSGPIHFHSALFLLSLSMPFSLIALSSLLLKTALHGAGQVKSDWMSKIAKRAEDGWFLRVGLGLFVLSALEMGRIFLKWGMTGFGALSEIDGAIRVLGLSIPATAFVCIDAALSVFQMAFIKEEGREEERSPVRKTKAIPKPVSKSVGRRRRA